MTAATPALVSEPPKMRVDAYDLLRGIGAFTVICIHAFPILLQGYAKNSEAWKIAVAANTLILFAVHAFIIITTLLMTKSLLRDGDFKRFYEKRLQTTLWPYLLWTTIHLFLSWRGDKSFRWSEAAFRVFSGKSYQHLYFLGVIIQLYLALPFLVPLFRKRPPFRIVLPAMIALTLLVYVSNRYLVHYPYVGSSVFWYMPDIMLGLFLGSQFDTVNAILKRWTPALAVIAVGAGSVYVPLMIGNMGGVNVNTFYYQLAEWAYTNSMALLLLSLCFRLPQEFTGKSLLLLFGRNSMALYLLHRFPSVLLPGLLKSFHIPLIPLFIMDVIVSLAVPLMIARIIDGTKLEVFLFGRG